jgi:hypothetical protein
MKKIIFSIIHISILLLSYVSPIFSEKDEDTQSGTIIEFPEVWKHVMENSHSSKAGMYDEKSAEIAKNRASKHWIPKIYTDVRGYNTNDPAMNFFSNLGQRSALDSDFSTKSSRSRVSNFVDTNNALYTTPNYNTLNLFAPDTLNNPGSNTYSRGTLGVDMPLYEGGSKSNISKMTEKKLEGKRKEREFSVQNEFFSTAYSYSTIIVMNNYLKKLKDLNKIVEGIQKRFPLKGSPIGYSGYLGIKSLQNYLKGTKETVRSQITAQKEFIQINTGNKISDWIPKDDTSLQFAEKYLPIEKREDDSPEMKITKAYKSYAEGTEIQIEAEKARFLPRVGVYGEAYAYNGSRDTATSYNAGLYLQMNLLSPTDIGIIEESKNNSLAIKERVEEMKQRDKAKFSSLIRMEKVFKENIILMNETQKLQEEQINNSQNLFSSGSINILQLAEVMNSVAEFYRKKAEVETEYLRIRSELTLFNPSNSGDLK